MGIPITRIRRFYDRLIFVIGIHISGKMLPVLKRDPGGTWNRVVATKPVSSVSLISVLFSIENTHWILNITFIFDRFGHSSASVASVEYKCDSNNLRGTFCKIEILLTEKLTNGAMVTPTPVSTEIFGLILGWCGSVVYQIISYWFL